MSLYKKQPFFPILPLINLLSVAAGRCHDRPPAVRFLRHGHGRRRDGWERGRRRRRRGPVQRGRRRGPEPVRPRGRADAGVHAAGAARRHQQRDPTDPGGEGHDRGEGRGAGVQGRKRRAHELALGKLYCVIKGVLPAGN